MREKSIGVFDSGLGGISVLKKLITFLPNENFIYYGDSKNAPYGIKTKEEIEKRCFDIFDFFEKKNVKAIVIACNTATSAAAFDLRNVYKNLVIVGMEPALKVATYGNENNNIVVMATPLTLKSEKFDILMNKFSGNNNIIKMPCPELVNIVENNKLNNKELIKNQILEYYKNIDIQKIDSIVLGCTHFTFFKNYIREFLDLPDKIKIIDGNFGTANHLKEMLEQSNNLNLSNEIGNVEFYNSSDDKRYLELSKELLNSKYLD